MEKTKRAITVYQAGNRIILDPSTTRVKRLVEPLLTYAEPVFLRGKERRDAIKRGHSPVFDRMWECFVYDHKDRIGTSLGFLPRIKAFLESEGYPVTVKCLTPHPNPAVYEPRWDRVEGEEFRYKQRRVLELIAKHDFGRISCPPGYGKSYLIGQAARMYPKAKIAVVTRRVEVMQQRIYPELCGMIPSVGMVGGGIKKKGRRVMCYTAASLQHIDGDEDFVFFDEGHEAASDDCAAKMANFAHAHMWSFSASWDMRLDNKDMRCEAMFGPIRLHVSYEQSVKHGMIVPIAIMWGDVIMDENPASGYIETDKQRYGIWANDYRNEIITKDAHRYDDDTQVLISVANIEHGLYLNKLLPEFKFVYNGSNLKHSDLKYFRKLGLCDSSFGPMDIDKRRMYANRFTRGKLKKAIATTVWNVGVDFKKLQVLIRADAGGSPINDTQIPGRTSRTNQEGKAVGVVHDYLDQFDTGFHKKAIGRGTSYTMQGWEQIMPSQDKKGLLEKLMEWGTI